MTAISIITICFNNLQETVSTCQSVDMQQNKPFEHIIIDGSETPEIKNYLEQNTQPAYRKWICEPDRGIADAFNKGLRLANGNIVVMLNSGDTLIDQSVIATVNKVFEENTSLQWLHGKYQLIRGDRQVTIGKPFEKSKLYRGMRSICHQTMFVKKALHDKYGMYDINEKIGMDYDFLCRIAGEPFTFIHSTLVNFAPAGTSSVLYLQALKDARRIYEKYYGKSFKLILWQLRLKILFYLLRSPAGNFLYTIKTKLKLENM
ncbi:MAG: glycosyltransferase [Chitinophagaceae bacterium]|nr:glycosyltransferase [Chitinophagaceae bacterium]